MSLNGSNGFIVPGGSSVSTAGDINGDNIGDLIIGAPAASLSGSYVIFGGLASVTLIKNELNITQGQTFPGTEGLVQSVPMYSPKKVVQMIKSITAREAFIRFPGLKKKLWGGEFWSKGYFISTVGKHGDEKMLKNYVRNQGVSKSYQVLHQGQLSLL